MPDEKSSSYESLIAEGDMAGSVGDAVVARYLKLVVRLTALDQIDVEHRRDPVVQGEIVAVPGLFGEHFRGEGRDRRNVAERDRFVVGKLRLRRHRQNLRRAGPRVLTYAVTGYVGRTRFASVEDHARREDAKVPDVRSFRRTGDRDCNALLEVEILPRLRGIQRGRAAHTGNRPGDLRVRAGSCAGCDSDD